MTWEHVVKIDSIYTLVNFRAIYTLILQDTDFCV